MYLLHVFYSHKHRLHPLSMLRTIFFNLAYSYNRRMTTQDSFSLLSTLLFGTVALPLPMICFFILLNT